MARERTGASSSFDELAVGLSSGTLSRGKAIRLMGAALLGGVLAFTPKVAEAEIHNPHKCNSAGKCTTGSCCSGTCCGEGEKGVPVSCVPAAPACQGGRDKGRVQTHCYTLDGEPTCLSGCGTFAPCNTTADCDAIPISRGMVCAKQLPGDEVSVCISPCR
jgi:hypothetical protein